MPFTVENGTGVTGANSYVSVAYADAYFTDRANGAWAANENKEGCLISATDYIEKVFARRFIGEMANAAFSLSWPRNGADPYASNVIPDRLMKAACEYALRAINGKLMPDPVYQDSG